MDKTARLRLKAGIALCACFPFFARPASGQDAGRPQDLHYEVNVTLKLIQVCITDKKGRPVRDLTKADFVLFDDGKPVTLTEFEKHDLGSPAVENNTASSSEPSAGATPRPQSLGRTFFLFFDFAFNTQKGIVKAIEASGRFLKSQFQANDRVALVTYSMLRGITVHEYLTPDLDKIREALAGLSGKEFAGRADEIEQEYWQQAADLAPAGLGDRRNADAAKLEMQRRESKSQAHVYLLRLTTLAQALRLVPGQKTILFFSTGVPYSLIFGNQSSTPDTLASASKFDMGDSLLRPLYEQTVKEFAASNCTVYTLDTRESAKVSNLFAYDEQRASAFDGPAGSGSVFSTKTDPFRDDKTTGLGSLTILSKDTGGQYFGNISRYDKSLDQIQSLTGTYYVLGYRTPQAEDGRFHEVKVEVKRPGCQVRGQAGYFNPKPFRDYSKLEKDIQLFDLALNERSGGHAPKTFPLASFFYDPGSAPHLLTMARIPADVRQAVAGKSVEFVGLVFDEAQNLLSLQRTVAELSGQGASDLLFSFEAHPRAGRCRSRVVIRNLETGASAVASAPVDVLEPKPAGLTLYSIMLLRPEFGVVSLDGVAKGSRDLVAWRDVYAYDSLSSSPVVGSEDPVRGEVTALVPFSMSGQGSSGLVFSANLVNSASGANIPLAIEMGGLTVRGPFEVQNMTLPLKDVAPGQYILYVHAQERTSAAKASVHTNVTIR